MSKLTWQELSQYDNNPPVNKALPRSKSVQKRYGGYLGALKRRGTTIEQDVMNRIIEHHRDQQIIVTKNDFSYNVEDGINHLVVWVNPLIYQLDNVGGDFAREYVKSLLPHDTAFIMFENLPGNKSVGNVHHYQLFVRGDLGLLPIERL